ncbi:SCO family protein [Sulfurimonas sp.]|uniref:SCO family protein n=1 Tax=Sulfurimonas sp. TaxID=2022749 RepID=UPI002AB18C3E|nr:SCO family protein [Sulfurimonas sp.]
MQKKIYAVLIIGFVVAISISVMIIPIFFTKGISRTKLNKEFTLPMILSDEQDIELVFFGYSGCTDICMPKLFDIQKLYDTLEKNIKQKVGVIFVDISMPKDEELPQRFAEFFNIEFKGIYLNQTILRDYTKVFNVYFSQSLLENTEYDHTTNLYLVKKSKGKKEIRYIYNAYPYDIKQIKQDIKELRYE